MTEPPDDQSQPTDPHGIPPQNPEYPQQPYPAGPGGPPPPGGYPAGQYGGGPGGPYPPGQYGGGPGAPYPPGGYPGQQQPPAPPRQPVTIATLLGARAWRRPEARFGPALAGAGAALAVLGIYIWSIGYLVKGFGFDFYAGDGGFYATPHVHGTGRRFLGFGLFLAFTAVGYLTVVVRRRGPLATAGTVATVLGVPALLMFLFLDIKGALQNGDFPINVDAVFLISIVVYLVSYLVVPGARGRAVYLAAAAVALPGYISFKVGVESSFQHAVSGTGGGAESLLESHTGAVAAVGLAFGLVYYLIAWLLDRSGRSGVAIGLLYPAFVVTVSGIVAGADPFGQAGTGVLLLLVGTVLALYGGRYGRRFTTWAWAGAAMLGLVVLVTEIDTDKYWLIGVLLLVFGAAAAVAGQAASGALGERTDVDEQAVAGQ